MWTQKMESEYKNRITHSIEDSVIYHYGTENIFIGNEYGDSGCIQDSDVELVDMDTVSAIHKFAPHPYGYETPRIAALNFASYKHPGGMFYEGSSAQEESLCHASTLYPVLKSFEGSFYAVNKKKLNRALYNSDILFTPGIIFPKSTEYEHDTICHVITSAAPNWGAASRYQKVTKEELLQVFKQRIDAIMVVAEMQAIDIIVLGAFGCGVFRNDPHMVAELFKESIEKHFSKSFKKIVFAIPDKMSKNYKAFAEVLGKYCS